MMTKDRENVKESNCERIDQVIDEYTLKSAEKHSSFCSELCVLNGPNGTSILPTNICTEVDQQGSLVFQTKDDKYTKTTHIEDGILNAINVIRYHCKKRPDATSIPDYLVRTSNADKSTVLRVLQSLKDTCRVHVRMIKGKESYFIGKSPSLEESHNSNEVVDQTYDSFLEILNGIDTPPEKDLPSNSQQTVEGSFPSSFIEIISKLVDNNISLTNFLKNEKNFSNELAEQISDLRHKIQSLETNVIEIKQSMFKKHSELQAHENLSERMLSCTPPTQLKIKRALKIVLKRTF